LPVDWLGEGFTADVKYIFENKVLPPVDGSSSA
jgi:hypothetical protein